MTPAESAARALARVWAAIEGGARTILIDSPPGAGKSTLVREIARRYRTRAQVPIVVQTNDQADDMVRGFAADSRLQGSDPVTVGRLHAGGYAPPEGLSAVCSNSIDDLRSCDVVVAPAAKWATVDVEANAWPFAVVDEAYQMRSDALLPVGTMMASLLLVGDPGQLSPFTTADDTPHRGRPGSPLETAAATVIHHHRDTVRVALPVSWRLPEAAAALISDAFYEVPFVSGTTVAQRQLRRGLAPLSRGRARAAVDSAIRHGWAFVELDRMPMPSTDPEAVEHIVEIVTELVASRITVSDEGGERPLSPEAIAVGVTHRAQRDQVRLALARRSRDDLALDLVVVDTANVLQGREFEVVVAWHPLSGRLDASAFHLDAGRLCVLLSRHRQACILVGRAGMREQLAGQAATDPIWLGESAQPVDGWHAHLAVLDHLAAFAA